MSNLGYKHWLMPTLPAMEKILSPILEIEEAENIKTEIEEFSEKKVQEIERKNSDPTFETLILQTNGTLH
jgi:hypothetical protein